jgi:hypothetical protein
MRWRRSPGVRLTRPARRLFDLRTRPKSPRGILSQILASLSGICWRQRHWHEALGDCWRHDAAGPGLTNGWVPFHKIVAWLTYSLLEPSNGRRARGNLDALTGLPNIATAACCWTRACCVCANRRGRAPLEVSDELVVEWRALTVAARELARLRTRRWAMPDRCRWPACSRADPGRRAVLSPSDCARRPPLSVASDGTIF